jgi:FkbM family methyltransferase
MSSKIIYDFGSNNGDDIPYYLKKADVVVAVEADPKLAELIRLRFRTEIAHGRLFLENCVLVASGSLATVAFYVHRTNNVLSQLPKPPAAEIGSFDELMLPTSTPKRLIEKYGPPFYIKIDIEHCDAAILNELFTHGIRPPFISAESHSIEVFALMVAAGGYRSFNLVEGHSVSSRYREHSIKTALPHERYSFPHHSAGPFGEDIAGPWMLPETFFKRLALEDLGWKDIHATREIEPDTRVEIHLRKSQRRDLRLAAAAKRMLPRFLHPFARKLRVLLGLGA